MKYLEIFLWNDDRKKKHFDIWQVELGAWIYICILDASEDLICYLLSQLLAIRALEALFDLCVGAANQGGIVLRATAQMKPFWALSVVARDQISQQTRIRTLGAVSTRQQIHGVGRGTTHS